MGWDEWDEMEWGGVGWDRTERLRDSSWWVGQNSSHFCQGRDILLTVQNSSSFLSTAFFFAPSNVFCRAVEGEITLFLP